MQDPFSSVVGQPRAVDELRAALRRPVHAYLFSGPPGCGKRAAARAFAAALLDDERPLYDVHPDVMVVEREGAAINVSQAREIGRLAARSPVEGKRKVLILTEFHLVDEAAPALLKTIEEASESTVFVILADTVTRELVTVASRCVRVEFGALGDSVVRQALIDEGVTPERADEAVSMAFGNLDRARLLAADDTAVERRSLWADARGRLDGTGAAIAVVVDEIIASLDDASKPLLGRQAEEQERAQMAAKELGQPQATVLKALESKHKREQRRLRTDELRAGLAALSRELGRRVSDGAGQSSASALDGLRAVSWASESLTYNPNETLLLQGLFVRLSPAG